MKKSKAVMDFISLSVNDKLEFYRNVSLQMANTVIFPNLVIPISTINAKLDAFEATILAAKSGAHSAIADRNDQELICDDVFREIVNYVNVVSNGDETIIIKSGFNSSKQPSTFVKADMAVNDGLHSGSVLIVLKAVLNAVAYIVQYRRIDLIGSSGDWISVDFRTVANFQIDGLFAGGTYEFRFASISALGTSDYSNLVKKIVI